jgi:hypothetical protein
MAPGPLDPDLLGVWSVAPLDEYQISRGADFNDARPAEHRQEGDPSICEQAGTIEGKHVDVVVIRSHALDCPCGANTFSHRSAHCHPFRGDRMSACGTHFEHSFGGTTDIALPIRGCRATSPKAPSTLEGAAFLGRHLQLEGHLRMSNPTSTWTASDSSAVPLCRLILIRLIVCVGLISATLIDILDVSKTDSTQHLGCGRRIINDCRIE